MITNPLDHSLRFQQLFWFCLILLAALATGYFLATSFWLWAVGAMGFLWLVLLPYHSKIAIWLAIATYSSALIVPLFPGRPYMWEFAALLGWSGLVLTICMRQGAPDAWQMIRAHRWLFIGAAGYCLVLLITMSYRGVGLRILGSDVMGGRYYFQQLTCVVFPFLFVLLPPSERMLVRLFVLQCLLSFTFLISDFVLARAPESLFFLFRFFELSGDAVNFEMRAERFGIRRFQSFYVVGLGVFLLLLLKFRLADFFSARRAFVLIPITMAVLGLGFLSGHRYLALMVTGVVAFLTVAQRFFTFRNTFIAFAAMLCGLGFIYLASDRLPMAAQRAVSFLPGIEIDSQPRSDALATLETRRALRHIGLQMAPQYFWLGRGFALATVDMSWQWDPTTITAHANQGRFYNGFIGLMVNTGIFGTAFMLLFLASGLRLCWRVMIGLRTIGVEDEFLRLCGIVAGMWVANTLAFLFFHGDSEFAMKTFSLQAGMLLICHKHLVKRLREAEQSAVG